MKRIAGILFILLIAFVGNAVSQPSIKATTDHIKVGLGEQFQASYEIIGNGNITQPAFNDFNSFGYQQSDQGTGVTVFSFILTPKKVGKFTVGPATLTSGGKSYQSGNISVEVTRTASQNQGNNKGGQGGQARGKAKDNLGEDNIYVRLSVDKTSVYLGEAVVATYKVYSKYSVMENLCDKTPSNNGFYSLDIDAPRQTQYTRENINGATYLVGTFKKVVLYPQQVGTLELDPLNVTIIVGNMFSQAKAERASNSVKITVKELPPDAPASFKGAVGRYKMDAFLDKPETKANDPVSLKVKLAGNGNLKLVDPLPLEFPQDIEAYDPKIADNTSVTEGGVSGNKTFEYLLIPRHSGDYKIPPVEFSYFDLDKKKYVTLSSPEFNLKVAKGSGPESITINGVNKEDVQLLGKDIRYIKTNNALNLHKKGDEFYGSAGFYSLFVSPMFLFIGFLVYYRKNKELQRDTILLKSKKATKLARKRLSTAQVLLTKNSRELFYEEVSKAIWGYMGDKLSIPLSNLSKDTISEVLLSRGVSEILLSQFVNIINQCEFARFAPTNSEGHMQEVYNAAINSISKMEEELKS